MRYTSTRSSGVAGASFSDILLEGLAADGGLYLPEYYPIVDDTTLTTWRGLLATRGYAALVAEVLKLYVDDIPANDLEGIAQRAYTAEKFGSDDIVPLTDLGEGLLLGHLSNGPTAAFKDMAMQLLGELFEYELARRSARLTILGATSGDTGSSAEYALRGRPGISVFMLTPAGRMSAFQQAQMFGLPDANIHNIALDGIFDDCQDVVKQVNADAGFKVAHHIGAVNSINWARLLAQVCYYIAIWLRATTSNEQRISVAVPTGNFGNICAGHIARQMGVGIETLILATNENDVLDEFFRTGHYRVRAPAGVAETSSPSMDISKASNFERFIYDLLGRDATRVAELFGPRLATTGEIDLSNDPAFVTIRQRYGFVSGTSTHADRLAEIRDLYRRCGVLIDPHTADGMHVAKRWAGMVAAPIVVLETALPVKFADTITEAIGSAPQVPDRFRGIEDAARRVVDLPCDVEAVKRFISERD